MPQRQRDRVWGPWRLRMWSVQVPPNWGGQILLWSSLRMWWWTLWKVPKQTVWRYWHLQTYAKCFNKNAQFKHAFTTVFFQVKGNADVDYVNAMMAMNQQIVNAWNLMKVAWRNKLCVMVVANVCVTCVFAKGNTGEYDVTHVPLANCHAKSQGKRKIRPNYAASYKNHHTLFE